MQKQDHVIDSQFEEPSMRSIFIDDNDKTSGKQLRRLRAAY